jgi:hypothetical protein
MADRIVEGQRVVIFTAAEIRHIEADLQKPEVRAAAEYVLKGALTRLALGFSNNDLFTGHDVAAVLLQSWANYCASKDVLTPGAPGLPPAGPGTEVTPA